MKNLFHLAFPVHDLTAAREFYGGVLECDEARSSDHWVDFNLFGHQIVAHLAPESAGIKAANKVDADNVPVPHFGIRREIYHRAKDPLQRRGRRTVDNVFPRPQRQRTGI